MKRIVPNTRASIVSVAMGTLLVGFVLLGTGCPPRCATDAECDDGLFCNGAETCDGMFCQPGTNPCAEGETCDEDNDVCVPPGPAPCESDEDCAEGEVCNLDTGECEPAPTGCTSNADCAEGEFCDVVTGDCVPNENLYETVTFDHTAHMPRAPECTFCHHLGTVACDTCHDRDEVVNGTPVLKDAQHDPDNYGCWVCHDEQNPDGTRDCSVCHTALPD